MLYFSLFFRPARPHMKIKTAGDLLTLHARSVELSKK